MKLTPQPHSSFVDSIWLWSQMLPVAASFGPYTTDVLRINGRVSFRIPPIYKGLIRFNLIRFAFETILFTQRQKAGHLGGFGETGATKKFWAIVQGAGSREGIRHS